MTERSAFICYMITILCCTGGGALMGAGQFLNNHPWLVLYGFLIMTVGAIVCCGCLLK